MILNLAPAQGLFLDMSYFSSYNDRREDEAMRISWHEECADDDDDHQSPVARRWRDFRDRTVVRHIVEEEEREGNFLKYLYVHDTAFDRSRYTHPTPEPS